MVTGDIQGLSIWSGSASAAFCRSVTGTVRIASPAIYKPGAGGQIATGKGAVEAVVDFEAVGVTAAHAELWFPTSADLQVASFPDFVVTTGNLQFTLEDGQPGAGTISVAEGGDFLTLRGTMKFATVTPAAAAVSHAYNSAAGHTNSNIVVSFDGDIGCLSFEVSNGADAAISHAMDTASTGEQTWPTGVAHVLGTPSLTAVLRDELTATSLLADAYDLGNVVITCDNGTGAEDVTITVVDVDQAEFNGPVQAEGLVGFAYTFAMGSGTRYNRVQFS